MKQARTLHLPIANSHEEAEITYDKALRSLVIELGTHFDMCAKPVLGENWFHDLMSHGHSAEEQSFWKSKYDPAFVFGEILNHADSPLRDALPNKPEYLASYKKARQIRNAWAHSFGEFGLNQLHIDLQHFQNVALGADLPVAKSLPGVISRIKAILAGDYVHRDDATKEIPLPQETDSTEAIAALDQEEDIRQRSSRGISPDAEVPSRPRIGGRWRSTKPGRALRVLPKLNDVVDRQTNKSVKPELGENADSEISRWLQPQPIGDLFVAEDHAVMGYIQGEPYLLGYLGIAPQRDPHELEGFVLKYSYSLEGDDIREELTQSLLSAVAAEETEQLRAVIKSAVNPIDELKITTHGDLFSYTENGPVKIARVPAALWFPGHLVK